MPSGAAGGATPASDAPSNEAPAVHHPVFAHFSSYSGPMEAGFEIDLFLV